MQDFHDYNAIDDKPPVVDAPLPAISIYHLMLWTFWTSAYLAGIRLFFSLIEDRSFRHGVSDGGVFFLLYGVSIGAVLAGATVLCIERIRRRAPVFRQPGHWLLLGMATMVILTFPLQIGVILLEDHRGYGWVYFVTGWCSAVVAAIYAFAATHTHGRFWRVFLWALAAAALLASLVHMSMWLEFSYGFITFSFSPNIIVVPIWSQILLAACLFAAATYDRITGHRRDWLHWTGVVAFIGTYLVALIQMIALS